jgi:putative endonuclease
VTSQLPIRYFQHKTKFYSGFTAKYNINQLVYCEPFLRVDDAIAREKEIKGWTRKKKIGLIESANPNWDDLSAQWTDQFKPKPRSFAQVSRLGESRREPSFAQDDSIKVK